ncbi:hypothetical protein Mapa_007774 [Marchantia paleacea]|nr:hypothetical protein Mapa_007774 [Marchantia paleacea]
MYIENTWQPVYLFKIHSICKNYMLGTLRKEIKPRTRSSNPSWLECFPFSPVYSWLDVTSHDIFDVFVRPKAATTG